MNLIFIASPILLLRFFFLIRFHPRPQPGNIPFSPTPLGRPQAFTESAGSRSTSCVTASSTQVDSLAVDIEPNDFLPAVQEAEKSGVLGFSSFC